MFRFHRNAGFSHASHSKSRDLKYGIVESESLRLSKSKGGRPKKTDKKDQFINVRCTLAEKKIISAKANGIALKPAEYLRTVGLNQQIVMKRKTLPLEVLQVIGQLNHLSSNMNQFARKMNMNDRFTMSDYINFSKLTGEIKIILPLIKSYVQ
jgi:hypothetical protein